MEQDRDTNKPWPDFEANNIPVNRQQYEGSRENLNDGDDDDSDIEPLSRHFYLTLPRHSHLGVNTILEKTEGVLRALHRHSKKVQNDHIAAAKEAGLRHEVVYANTYVDLGKINVIGYVRDSCLFDLPISTASGSKHALLNTFGSYHSLIYVPRLTHAHRFDFDYTLVTYTEQLLELIYDMALKRLVKDRQYPSDMLGNSRLKFDPFFSIRGLAVDLKTGWITHLSYTHKVAVAWEGREKLPTSRIFEEYRGKRALRPSERSRRLKPLNDLFSMAECCLIADTIQFFKDQNIPHCPQSVVNDVLKVVTETHLSGDFHRLVASRPDQYFNPTPHLESVLTNLKESGKHLIFVSNSPFWYVDAGMRYVFGKFDVQFWLYVASNSRFSEGHGFLTLECWLILLGLGDDWRKEWDAIITSAGKPNFYTDEARPFREICLDTRRLLFRPVERFEPGKVYTEGCLKELSRLMQWKNATPAGVHGVSLNGASNGTTTFVATNGASSMDDMNFASANVLYVGDSLFADLVDAKREFGWTTAAVTPEVGYEMEMKNQADFVLAQRSVNLLLNALRLMQDELGSGVRSREDILVLDALERLVSLWRDRETVLLGSPFGSVFRARYQPSLFAHSLRRYCDLYMPSVSSLRHYSPQHRFYPEQDMRLLAHEIRDGEAECWELDDVLQRGDAADQSYVS